MMRLLIVTIVANVYEIEQQLVQDVMQDVSAVEFTINQHSHDYSLGALLDQCTLTTIEIHGSIAVFVLKATKAEPWTEIIKPHLSTQLGPKS